LRTFDEEKAKEGIEMRNSQKARINWRFAREKAREKFNIITYQD